MQLQCRQMHPRDDYETRERDSLLDAWFFLLNLKDVLSSPAYELSTHCDYLYPNTTILLSLGNGQR